MKDILQYLHDWFDRHGSPIFDSYEDWINSMSNVELLTWIEYYHDDKENHGNLP